MMKNDADKQSPTAVKHLQVLPIKSLPDKCPIYWGESLREITCYYQSYHKPAILLRRP
jgi:hypothetical protein